MTYADVICYGWINSVDDKKVANLVDRMLQHGWQGMPILLCGSTLITGSHRRAALCKIEEMWGEALWAGTPMDRPQVLTQDVAEDVTDLIEDWAERNADCDIPFDRLRLIFAGTWVEEYKDELEW